MGDLSLSSDPGMSPPTAPSGSSAGGSSRGGGDGLGLGAYIGGAAALGGGILNFIGGENTNAANAVEAQKNRDFSAQQTGIARDYDQAKTIWQSTHGYQNAVADMRAAGLNPVLAGLKASPEGGSGGGPQASVPGNAQMQNPVGPAISSGLQGMSLVNDILNSQSQRTLQAAQAATATAQANRETSSAKNLDMTTQFLRDTYKDRASSTKAEAETSAIDAKYRSAEKISNLINSTIGTITNAVGAAKGISLPQRNTRDATLNPPAATQEQIRLERAGRNGIPVP